MTFYYHANKTHFHKKGFSPGLVLKVRVFGTRKWPIARTVGECNFKNFQNITSGHKSRNARVNMRFLRFFVYYILNKIAPYRYFTRIGRTLLDTLKHFFSMVSNMLVRFI